MPYPHTLDYGGKVNQGQEQAYFAHTQIIEPTRVKHLSLVPHLGRLLALSTNITLGWKGKPVQNTLAYLACKLRT
jgi:hypothetical protein